MHDTLLAATVLGAICVGIGVMLLTAQHLSRPSIGMAGIYVLVGPAIPLSNHLGGTVGSGPELLARAEGLMEAAAMGMAFVYVDALAVTASLSAHARGRFGLALRTGFALTAVIGVAGLVDPATRLNEFQFHLLDPTYHGRPGLWLFAGLWLLATLVAMYGYVLLLGAQLDPGERARSICTLIASPMLVSCLVVPRPAVLAIGTTSMLVTLYGQYRFAVSQGERGAFLSRFLSPQVAEQVRMDGMTSVMQPGELEVTVVACDLRGFTSYAEAVPSQAVIDLLGEYYDAVGRAVAEVAGTVKDYAGDGILVLVGAPLPRDDHARAGLVLARRIHDVTGPVIARWSTRPHPLGIGVGVATGRVTVGAIGSDARMEYTAVGTAVNLASRLCAAAAAGETLVDGRLAPDAGAEDLRPHEPVRLKGFGDEVTVFAVTTAAP